MKKEKENIEDKLKQQIEKNKDVSEALKKMLDELNKKSKSDNTKNKTN